MTVSRHQRSSTLLLVLLLALAGAACAGQPSSGEGETAGGSEPRPVEGTTYSCGEGALCATEDVRLYTTVTQDTVDAVVGAFESDTGRTVEVFRAPTGEFNARVAAERREGEIRADVFWLTDPLSMWPFADEGLLAEWTPEGADALDEAYRSDTFWGTRLLNLVIVARDDLDPAPASWADLTDPAYADAVAIPDPGFAGSAFAALGFFGLDADFGMDYYQALADNGVTQVQAPDEVTAGVAEGRFAAGITLDRSARDAVDDGSPVQLVWPTDGAIAVYSPIAVLADSATPETDAWPAPPTGSAEAFVEFVLSVEAQQLIADTGWQPVHPDVAWPHGGGEQVAPDWGAAFAERERLLEEYRAIVGG